MDFQHQEWCKEMMLQGMNEGGSKKRDNISNYMYPQSSTRWRPTSNQLRILEDLYNDKEIRSPSEEQIQRICGILRQFGRIEEKNVFYWFQNRKTRETQKRRRLATTANVTLNAAPHDGVPYNNRVFLEQEEERRDDNQKCLKIETLTLFPLHADGGGSSNDVSIDFYTISNDSSMGYGCTTPSRAWLHGDDNVMTSPGVSLELRL